MLGYSEYVKLAKKIRKEELGDLITIAKIDGTANDSPVDELDTSLRLPPGPGQGRSSEDWSSFPTIFFVKEIPPEAREQSARAPRPIRKKKGLHQEGRGALRGAFGGVPRCAVWVVHRTAARPPPASSGAALVTKRRDPLEPVQLRRRQDHPAYCQGYHELAAVMLLVCMDVEHGWLEMRFRPSTTSFFLTYQQRGGQEQLGQSNVVDEGDLKVYEELCSAESVPADAQVLLEALLYEHRLVDLYEPSSSSNGEEEAVVAGGPRVVDRQMQRWRHAQSKDGRTEELAAAAQMASIIAGTWSLISSSAEVISKARGMTVGIHRLLQPDAVDLHEADRRRLVGLQRRVQCMVQPLNFLLLWSKSRDDRVQQVVLSAQELLFDIYTFIEDLSADPNGSTIHAGRAPSSRGSGPLVRPSNATKSEQLDFFLRELDFTCISVNMAITMETRAPPGSTPDVSLLAFLRAHRRIKDGGGAKEMEGCSGHLCALLGCLYKGADGSGCWSPALSLATFKVIARGETAGDGTRAAGRATSSKSCPRFGLGLNASARLDFPIASILDAHLVTTGQLNLAASPASPCAGAQELQALRCRRITAGLRRIAPDVAYEIESWGLTPHVLLLRWVRLLFLRELKFPSDVLIAWDAIFADAHCANSDEAAPAPEGVLPSSAALPLVDYLALAMILAAPPSKPEELLHFNERAPEVRKLLAFSWQLRDFANSMPRPSGMRRPGGRPFPQPPAACYPKIGVQKPAHSEKDCSSF
eukprot:g10314.t1